MKLTLELNENQFHMIQGALMAVHPAFKDRSLMARNLVVTLMLLSNEDTRDLIRKVDIIDKQIFPENHQNVRSN